MGLFGPTVRDFSKSQDGRQCLEALFDYDALPNPNLTHLSSDGDFAKDILGRAFEYLLKLLIERQNPDFEFETSFKRRFRDARTKEARQVKQYMESGEPTDDLLECLISLGKECQKAFKVSGTRSKRIVRDGLKAELRRIHSLALSQQWNIKRFFYQSWLTDGRVFTAQADLVLDSSLIELKTTEDARRHTEHASQLFAYYMLSQAPARNSGPFTIDELGIYYARHGVLIKRRIAELVRFPLNRACRVAFDFWMEFSRWRTRRLRGLDQKTDAKLINNYAMLDIVDELCPRPDWAAKALSNRYKKIKSGSGCYFTPRQIAVPKNFLLKTN